MKVLSRLRRGLARLVLRGWLLDWWLRRKVSRLERRYVAELVRASTNPAPAGAPPGVKHGDPLRRILFISDVQWELKELAPELEKICSLEMLNLRPHLPQGMAHHALADVVRSVVNDFVVARPSLEPDVVLLYARAAILSHGLFEVLRERWACPLLGMNLDDKIEFLDYGLYSEVNDNYQEWAKRFDLNLSNVRAVVDWYHDRGLPVYYMPEGYHLKPGLGLPTHATGYRYEISFVGSKRLERETFIRRLQRLGVPVEPIGFGWPNSEGGHHPESVYRASLINLGIGFAAPSRTLTTLKTRDFECPGSGACYLTTYNWELGLHYDLGKEILCYRSMEELVELFSFYRRRPQACLAIAQAAYRRCLNEHTWEKRFRKAFREMGFGDV
jgi:hypothetical protein